jgi:coenzyme PQQ synthesis protein D (PqqD)
MMAATRYRINHPKVVNETIDGEVVILNLERGHYYSLTSVGMEIWTLIEGDASVAEIVAALGERYDHDPEQLKRSVGDLIADFEREELVQPSGELPGAAREPAHDWRAGEPGPKRVFEPPVLRKYTDMEDLLLLDPIHDADETGWPAPKPGGVDAGA